jgi:hypothetical protein
VREWDDPGDDKLLEVQHVRQSADDPTPAVHQVEQGDLVDLLHSQREHVLSKLGLVGVWLPDDVQLQLELNRSERGRTGGQENKKEASNFTRVHAHPVSHQQRIDGDLQRQHVVLV